MPSLTEADLIACAKIIGIGVGIANVWVWSKVAKRSAWWRNLTQRMAKGVQVSMKEEFPDLHANATFTEYRAYGKRWMALSMSDWSNHWSRNLSFTEFKQALCNANAPAIPDIPNSRNLDMFIEGAWSEYTRRVDRK